MRAVHPTVLDTDVASLLHRRKLTGPLATRLIGREPLITFVTFGELTKWAEIRHGGVRRREELAIRRPCAARRRTGGRHLGPPVRCGHVVMGVTRRLDEDAGPDGTLVTA